jgi:DNA repair protein RadC
MTAPPTLPDAADVGLLESLYPRADWRQALLELGGMVGLVHATDGQLLEHLPARAVQALRASLEVSRRYRLSREERPRLATPHAIDEYLRPALAHLAVEHFVVLSLNARNTLLRHDTVAVGTTDQCAVDPRAVFTPAVLVRAASIALAHNHPSGDPEPSTHDVALTRQLVEGGRALCIRVVDHLVIAQGGYVSLQARGLMGAVR